MSEKIDGYKNQTLTTWNSSKPLLRKPYVCNHQAQLAHVRPMKIATSEATMSRQAPVWLSTYGNCSGTRECGPTRWSSDPKGSWPQMRIWVLEVKTSSTFLLVRVEDHALAWHSVCWCFNSCWLDWFRGLTWKPRMTCQWICVKDWVLAYQSLMRLKFSSLLAFLHSSTSVFEAIPAG